MTTTIKSINNDMIMENTSWYFQALPCLIPSSLLIWSSLMYPSSNHHFFTLQLLYLYTANPTPYKKIWKPMYSWWNELNVSNLNWIKEIIWTKAKDIFIIFGDDHASTLQASRKTPLANLASVFHHHQISFKQK